MTDIDATRNTLKDQGFAIIEYDDRPIHSYPYDAPWLDDKEFEKLYESVRNNTLVDRTRCYSHFQMAKQVADLQGDVLEVGTWQGGTAGILTKLLPEKTVYLADTFEGVVKSSEWEHYKDKAHSDTSEELVKDFLTNRLEVSNYKLLVGIFPEDTGELVNHKQWSYVHIDVDVYQSAKDIFEYVWGNVVTGGIVVFDDYGFTTACAGIYKYVNEIKYDKDKLFIHNTNGHAYIIKRGSKV